ncbi:hypothetical protein NGR_c31650 [Sinorhizobium fredii NGR234]|uniref:Uncharacterized protein n=1 Tax=Sinorhizobium fredii (strain NBRC 101917 / NGR234) TaxID=394 RepID=C3M9X4_SINFN|nr:hypothetical protein NGR_c31650 [Sinorhizobium fredii NGR234]
MPHFECGAFNHSATSPRGRLELCERGRFIAAVSVADKGQKEEYLQPAAFRLDKHLTRKGDSRNSRREVVWPARTAPGTGLCPSLVEAEGFLAALRSIGTTDKKTALLSRQRAGPNMKG